MWWIDHQDVVCACSVSTPLPSSEEREENIGQQFHTATTKSYEIPGGLV